MGEKKTGKKKCITMNAVSNKKFEFILLVIGVVVIAIAWQQQHIFFVTNTPTKNNDSEIEKNVWHGACESLVDLAADKIRDPVFRIEEQLPSCPFVARKSLVDEDWLGSKLWSKFKLYSLQMNAKIALDFSSKQIRQETIFRYWDNNSLLSKTALNLNKIAPNYEKRQMLSSQALDRILLSPNGGTQQGVRYGGTAKEFFGDHAEYELFNLVKRFWPLEQNCTTRRLGLWLGSENTASSPHYDSFHNAFLLLAGQKIVILSPSSCSSKFFDIYPTTHPEARQAKPNEKTNCPHSFHTVLLPGDLVYIPAGWIHTFSNVQNTGPSAAISLTTLPSEFYHFSNWVQSPTDSLPFLQRPVQNNEHWSHPRLIASIFYFALHLHTQLDQLTEAKYALSSFFGTHPFAAYHDLVHRAYDDHTRQSLGIPPRSRRRHPCPWSIHISDQDAAAAGHAAFLVAHIFKRYYRPSLRFLYLAPYLENILSKVAPPRQPHNTTVAILLDFIDLCLLPPSISSSTFKSA